VLHSFDAPVALSVFLDIHTAKQPEQRDPQDEQDRVPDEEQRDACDEGDEVQQRGDGGEGGRDFRIDLCGGASVAYQTINTEMD
jgi:hypothetical protein